MRSNATYFDIKTNNFWNFNSKELLLYRIDGLDTSKEALLKTLYYAKNTLWEVLGGEEELRFIISTEWLFNYVFEDF